MDTKKHNPLTDSYPQFDKILALFRKGMIINECTELGIRFRFYSFNMVEFSIYQTKEPDANNVFAEMIVMDNKEADNSILLIKYVFNHILNKGTFPKETPTFSYYKTN